MVATVGAAEPEYIGKRREKVKGGGRERERGREMGGRGEGGGQNNF